MDQLAMMQAFVRVAEAQSFSEAARRMRTSKSLISRQVATLEGELGARLLHRTTRSLTLTEAGRNYYQRAARILEDIEDANLSVTQLQAAPRGRLRLEAPLSFGVLHLMPAIAVFLARCPEIDMDISFNDRFVDLVEDGIDVAVRIGRLADSSLVARRIAPMRRVICASPAYLERHGTPETPEALKDHPCLLYTNVPSAQEWRFQHPDGQPWPVEVQGRLRGNNGDALRVAALNGLGIVTLPSFIVGRDLQAGALVSLLADYVPQDAGIHAVYPHARHLSPKVRVFVDFLAEHFGPVPYWDLVE